MCHKNPWTEDRESFTVYVPNHRIATAKVFAYRALTKKSYFFLIIYNRARVPNIMFYQKEVIMTSLFKPEKIKQALQASLIFQMTEKILKFPESYG